MQVRCTCSFYLHFGIKSTIIGKCGATDTILPGYAMGGGLNAEQADSGRRKASYYFFPLESVARQSPQERKGHSTTASLFYGCPLIGHSKSVPLMMTIRGMQNILLHVTPRFERPLSQSEDLIEVT